MYLKNRRVWSSRTSLLLQAGLQRDNAASTGDLARFQMTTKKPPARENRGLRVSGAENRNRTYDLRVTSALLYRTELFRLQWESISV